MQTSILVLKLEQVYQVPLPPSSSTFQRLLVCNFLIRNICMDHSLGDPMSSLCPKMADLLIGSLDSKVGYTFGGAVFSLPFFSKTWGSLAFLTLAGITTGQENFFPMCHFWLSLEQQVLVMIIYSLVTSCIEYCNSIFIYMELLQYQIEWLMY